VSSDLASLVPNDAFAMLYAPSLDGLAAKVRNVVGLFDADAAAQMNVDAMLADAPPPLAPIVRRLDRTRPLAIVVSRPQGEGVPFSFVVPVSDTEGLQKEMGSANVAVNGGYALVSQRGPVPHGQSPLAKTAPAGDLAVRVNLASAAEIFRSEIDAGLSGVARDAGPAGGALEGIFGGVRKFVDSAEWLDVGLKIDGTRVSIDGEFRAKEGSALSKGFGSKGDMGEAVARLPKDFPVALAMSFDLTTLLDFQAQMMEALFSQLDAETRAPLEQMMAKSREMTAHMGDVHAMGFGMGGEGLEAAFVSTAKDAKAAIAKMREAYGTFPDMGPEMPTFELLPPANLDGTEVHEVRFGMPPEVEQGMSVVAGPGGLRMRVAAVGDKWLVGGLGPQALTQQTIASAKSPSKAAKALADFASAVGGKPTLLVRVDGRELARQVTDRLRTLSSNPAEVPQIPSGAPALFTVHLTSEGRVYRGGLSVELAAWKEVVETVMRSVNVRTTRVTDD
jgi:hypothetical protein